MYIETSPSSLQNPSSHILSNEILVSLAKVYGNNFVLNVTHFMLEFYYKKVHNIQFVQPNRNDCDVESPELSNSV